MNVQENFARGPGGDFRCIKSCFDGPFETAINALKGKKGLIVAAGGQAPGLNLVVKNLVNWSSPRTQIYGLNGGFPAIDNPQEHLARLVTGNTVDVSKEVNEVNGRYTPVAPKSDGTTLLLEMGRGSSEGGDIQQLAAFLQQRNFDFLVTIGGNGTLEATKTVENLLRQYGSAAQAIHIPKTVDGDLYGSTFGLLSAAAYMREQVKRITSEHGINGVDPVFNVFETMGRGSGKLVLEVGVTCRQVDLCLVPELEVSMDFIDKRVAAVLEREKGMNIVIAEGVRNIKGLSLREGEERMVDCLDRYLKSRFGAETRTRAKINKARWTYDPRAVGGLVSGDERIINGMCDTALRSLAVGVQGVSVIDTNAVLDLTKPRPEADRFEIDSETRSMLVRQGYPPHLIRASFL